MSTINPLHAYELAALELEVRSLDKDCGIEGDHVTAFFDDYRRYVIHLAGDLDDIQLSDLLKSVTIIELLMLTSVRSQQRFNLLLPSTWDSIRPMGWKADELAKTFGFRRYAKLRNLS